MARNAIESDFWLLKIAAVVHFFKTINKIKVGYWSEMARNAIESDFRSAEMVAGSEMARITYMQVKTKLLQFVRGSSWNWLDYINYCPSDRYPLNEYMYHV